MAWLMIVLAIVVCWLASICKIYFSAQSSWKATFLTEDKKKRNVLFVIAHPDDESMFFSPTINYLTSMGHNLHVLCASTGNADGMGNVRKEELFEACAILKVPLHQIKVLDDPQLQDGFGRVWDHNHLAKIIEEEVASGNIDLIFTFDDYGISGHCNHKDVHHGVRKFLNLSPGKTEAWELVSINLLRKYSGPVDIWLSIIYPMCYPKGQVHCLLNENPSKSFQAMSQHISQWVWFRKLFVSFSSYTYVNTINRIRTLTRIQLELAGEALCKFGSSSWHGSELLFVPPTPEMMNGRTYALIFFAWAVLTVITPTLILLSASSRPEDTDGLLAEAVKLRRSSIPLNTSSSAYSRGLGLWDLISALTRFSAKLNSTLLDDSPELQAV